MTRGIVKGPGGWTLTAEGAAVYAKDDTAVVADVHLGYEWARGDCGDCVPPRDEQPSECCRDGEAATSLGGSQSAARDL